MSYDPYSPYHARGKFLKPFRLRGKVRIHPLERAAYETYFEEKNPDGYHHDLGAQDVFLDNLGMLVAEQFDHWTHTERYLNTVRFLLQRWSMLKQEVLPDLPWWGGHYNSIQRQAAAGEPRSLLRLMKDEDWSRVDVETLVHQLDNRRRKQADDLSGDEHAPGFEDRPKYLGFFLDGHLTNPWAILSNYPWLEGLADELEKFADWPSGELIPRDWDEDGMPTVAPVGMVALGGIELPEEHSRSVDRLCILNPRECTPDLPPRVGLLESDRELYDEVIRDQGPHGTCASHAVSVGLDLALRRNGDPIDLDHQFSPAWIHCESARTEQSWSGGRSLGQLMEVVRDALPCSETAFPYGNGLAEFGHHRTNPRTRESQGYTRLYGCPLIRPLFRRYTEKGEDPTPDVANLKAHLAAGWVVVLSTSFAEGFASRGFREFGLPLAPLIGEERTGEGHAWLLVGYDHVDGNLQWKYQGRFAALNSWGPTWPPHQVLGEGLYFLPFSLLLTEALEAYAIRF